MESPPSGRIYFNTDGLPERDRFPATCEEFSRRLLALDCVNRSAAPFSALFDIRRVGRFRLAYLETSAADYVRTRELIRDGQEWLFINFLFEGTMFSSQPDSRHPINPGEAVMLDSTHVGGALFKTHARRLMLRIARSEFQHLVSPGFHFAGHRLERNPLARRLLFSYLRETRNLDFGDGGSAACLYDQHIFDLVVLALGVEGEARELAEQGGGRTARRSAVLREIETRVADSGLCAVTVARRLGVSARYVHVLLEETGRSFSQHVLDRRLERAAELLRQPGGAGRKIAEVAFACGFGDLSYFNRMFRRRYGATPSDMRAAARRGSGG
jgi:AraC-like DNA-binding protein